VKTRVRVRNGVPLAGTAARVKGDGEKFRMIILPRQDDEPLRVERLTSVEKIERAR
jgi:hypothetical protein